MLTVALVLVVGGFAAVAAALAWRTAHAAPRATPLAEADLPTVVVVVAARDEEATIGRCLDALLAQNYPPDRLEIVVADDGSTDRTAAVVRARSRRASVLVGAGQDFPAGAPGAGTPDRRTGGDGAPALREVVPRVRLVSVPSGAGALRGKANALHAAIATTTAEIVFVTDADCAPAPLWVRAKAASFADPATGLVCGLARIDPRPEHSFDRVQALDWAFMLGAVSAFAEAGVPAAGMGNNMAVRRAAYDAVGGYPALPFSVTEDFTLVHAVAEQTPWRVRFPIGAATTVWTLPADGVVAAYQQRRRWARGGLAGGPAIWAAYAGLWLAHALPLVGLAVAPLVTLGLVAVKMAAEGALLSAVLRRVGGRLRWRDLLGFEAFLFAYLVTLPAVLVLRPTIGWKGRRH